VSKCGFARGQERAKTVPWVYELSVVAPRAALPELVKQSIRSYIERRTRRHYT